MCWESKVAGIFDQMESQAFGLAFWGYQGAPFYEQK